MPRKTERRSLKRTPRQAWSSFATPGTNDSDVASTPRNPLIACREVKSVPGGTTRTRLASTRLARGATRRRHPSRPAARIDPVGPHVLHRDVRTVEKLAHRVTRDEPGLQRDDDRRPPRIDVCGRLGDLRWAVEAAQRGAEARRV